jgi:hypothetical protein
LKKETRISTVALAAIAVVAVAALLAACAQTPTTTNQPTTNVTPAPSTPSTTSTSTEASPTTGTGTTSSTPSATVSGVALGKMIYATGAGNTGVIAYSGGQANIKTGACLRCHGAKAKGGIGPNIQGAKLKPDFDETTFARAVTQGLDEEGKPLKTKMPKFQTTPEENQALWDYLNTLP